MRKIIFIVLIFLAILLSGNCGDSPGYSPYRTSLSGSEYNPFESVRYSELERKLRDYEFRIEMLEKKVRRLDTLEFNLITLEEKVALLELKTQ